MDIIRSAGAGVRLKANEPKTTVLMPEMDECTPYIVFCGFTFIAGGRKTY